MTVRLMRGQVVIRETSARESVIWIPEEGPRKIHTHRGVVLGKGPPMLRCVVDKNGGCTLTDCTHDVEVPHGFDVGDTVQFHFVHHADAHTRPWPDDGKPAVWVPQSAVDGVWEESASLAG